MLICRTPLFMNCIFFCFLIVNKKIDHVIYELKVNA